MITNFTEIRMGCSSVVRVAHIESPFAQYLEEQLGDGRYTFAFLADFLFSNPAHSAPLNQLTLL